MRVSGSTFFIYIYPSKFTLVVGLVPWAHGKVFFLVCVCVFFFFATESFVALMQRDTA